MRLKEFLDYKDIGIIDLSILLGYNSPQKIYRLFNTENASPSCQIIEDISNKFEELNLNWLFTGRGEMILSFELEENYRDKYILCLEEKEMLYKRLMS